MATQKPHRGSQWSSPDRGVDAAGTSRSRRTLLARLWLVVGGLALVEIAWVVLSFLDPRQRSKTVGPQTKIFDAGTVDRFAFATVTAFPRGRFYLARLEDGGFLALSRRCTHLGCTVPWNAEKKAFVCPCHASTFTIRGEVLQAPAPRPLDRFPVKIENDRVKVHLGTPIRRTAFFEKEVAYAQKPAAERLVRSKGKS